MIEENKPIDASAEGATQRRRELRPELARLPDGGINALVEVERDYLADKLAENALVREQLAQVETRFGDIEARIAALAGVAERIHALDDGTARLGTEAARLRQQFDRLIGRQEDALAGATARDQATLRRVVVELAQTRRHQATDFEAMMRLMAPAWSLSASVVSDWRYPAKLRGLRKLTAAFSRKRRARMQRERREYAVLKRSALFSRDYYLDAQPHLAQDGWDPILHYIRYGWRLGYRPGPLFDGVRYAAANPHLRDVNPLWHFLVFGVFEGRFAGTPFESLASARLDDSKAPMMQPGRATPVLWHYLGDTLDWLDHHARLTGVGRVSTELFFAGGDTDAPARPCVSGADEVSLAAISTNDLAGKLSGRLPSWKEGLGFDDRAAPQPGDHVFFTGLVWTPKFTRLFRRLDRDGVRFSVLVHDIIPLEGPEFADASQAQRFTEWLTVTLETADIVFVSNLAVKDQIARWAALSGVASRARIVPIAFGANELTSAPATAASSASFPRLHAVRHPSFVLSVGTIDRRKNQEFLCRLWRKLINDGMGEALPQLVLAGRDDAQLGASRSGFADLAAAGKILVLEGLSDEEVVALMQACRFTAFPSTNEGYGLPVAESLQLGKLCLASDLKVIREHAGDLAWYFPVDDLDSAAALFRKALSDDAAIKAAEARIAAQYNRPSWAAAHAAMAEAAAEAALSQRRKVAQGERPEFPGARVHDVAETLKKAARWCDHANPEVSILIINWNAASLTLECLRQIWANTEGHTYEILIADNGSRGDDLQRLAELGRGVRLLPLGSNRFFGEANNIAAEAARGRWLCLLNNDAFPQPGWLSAMIDTHRRNPQVGAVGPMFLFPNGTVQEAGSHVNAGGYPVRFGRGDTAPGPELLVEKFSDYISAAALLVNRDLFMQVGGFDLAYEPAYYEDTDLCFKLWAMGQPVIYCPESRVIHIEGSSANGDPEAEGRRKALGDLNRDKFVARWGTYLRDRRPELLVPIRDRFVPKLWTNAPRRDDLPRAAVYSPYALTPGGGERYILSLACVLAETHRVTVVTAHPYSHLRLRNLACEFGLDLSALSIQPEAEFVAGPAPDVFVCMGNAVAPHIAAHGRVAIYHCQFPFVQTERDGTGADLLKDYHAVIVNSAYTRRHYLAALAKAHACAPRVEIVHPPAPQIAAADDSRAKIILSVGRFFLGGHSKRQDVQIEAFKALLASGISDFELHLVGSSSVNSEDMGYLNHLRVMAEGLPIHFHVNCAHGDLLDLYRQASLYWHTAGMNVDLGQSPECAEHFGISLVEAMSAGVIPLAFDAGGPKEIITSGENGFLFSDVAGLVVQSRALVQKDVAELASLRAAARKRAGDFTYDNFRAVFLAVLAEVEDFSLAAMARQ